MACAFIMGSYTQREGHVPNGHGAGLTLLSVPDGAAPVSVPLVPNPTFVALAPPSSASTDALFAYAALEGHDDQPSGIAVLRIPIEHTSPDSAGAAARQPIVLQHLPAAGPGLCHIATTLVHAVPAAVPHDTTSASHPWVLVAAASYPHGSLALVAADRHTGRLVERSLVTLPPPVPASLARPDRQEAPHAHFVGWLPLCETGSDSRVALASVDLAADRILVFRVSLLVPPDSPQDVAVAAEHIPTAGCALPAGSGPRHVAFWSPPGAPVYPRLAAVVNELNNTVALFSIEHPFAPWTPLGAPVSSLPVDYTGTNHTSAIVFHPNGCAVYVANRGHNSIARCPLANDGASLRPADAWWPSGGRVPRDMALSADAKWLLVANQDSDNVCLFTVDQGPSCELHPYLNHGEYTVASPASVLALPCVHHIGS
jgi:6-phosphogluconolactonase (cycloisomerase 2 family)